MNAVLALGAALLWGGGDFAGGMGVKAAGGRFGSALRVVLMSHAASFCVLLMVARLRGDEFPRGAALAWGIGAGVAVGLALTLFYVALARGAMGASAAVSGLLAAAIPAFVAAWVEGAPDGRRVVGFCVAGAAIWLIAGAGEVAWGTMVLSVIAGIGFGVYFVALKFAGVAGVVWPMATVRIGSLALCSAMLAVASFGRSGDRVTIGREAVAWSLGTAVMDTSGNMMYIAATRAGRLDVAAVLASLYPATTILLAAWRLKEAPTRRQGWGMALAVVAVVLIAV